MKCPVCGEQVFEGQEVCENCGTEVRAQAEGASLSAGVIVPDPTSGSFSADTSLVAPPPAPEPAVSPPVTPPASARLLLKRAGILTGEEFPLGASVTIGRFDPDTGPVDIDLGRVPEAPYISRRHAEIYQDASGQWFVKDLGSSNGTFLWVAGSGQPQRVPAHQASTINDGDEIAFGNARFVFRTR